MLLFVFSSSLATANSEDIHLISGNLTGCNMMHDGRYTSLLTSYDDDSDFSFVAYNESINQFFDLACMYVAKLRLTGTNK